MTPETEEKVVAGLASIQATLEAQNKTLDSHSQSLSRVDYTLNGNGHPGLKQTVAEHGETLASIKKVLWIVGTPILSALGGGVVVAALWLVHQIK